MEAVYLANIPCPDCDYIETFVELTKTQTYVVNRRYMGREDFIQFEDKGKFNWIGDGTIVHLLDFDGPSYYEVDGERIYQLDSNLHRMTGPRAYDYVFNKDIYEGAGKFE